MKAMTFSEYGEPSVLTLRDDMPEPTPGPGPLTIAGLAIVVILAALAARAAIVRISRARRAEPDSVRLLERLARRDPDELQLDEADRLLKDVVRAHPGSHHPELGAIRQRFDDARYARDRSGIDAEALIADAARVARAIRQGGGG